MPLETVSAFIKIMCVRTMYWHFKEQNNNVNKLLVLSNCRIAKTRKDNRRLVWLGAVQNFPSHPYQRSNDSPFSAQHRTDRVPDACFTQYTFQCLNTSFICCVLKTL